MNQADHAVKLQFGVTLQQIIDMDERNQLLKSNLWLEYMWTDVNLAWNEVRRNLIYTESLVNTNLFYMNFTNTHFQNVPIPHLTLSELPDNFSFDLI